MTIYKTTYFPEDTKDFVNKQKNLKVKLGIDPTRDRLHLGHLVPIFLAKNLQSKGHHLDIILGTMTARLGDPSGQDKTRPILSKDEVEENADKILKQLDKILLPGYKVHYNHKFANELTVPEFLTSIVSKFTVASMLARDGFKNRFNAKQPIALHEFLVPLLQGWDSVKLENDIEIGGTDQLFNFQIARKLQESSGLTAQRCILTPILNGADGRKMSKTYGNVIWVDEEPNQMYSQVMSIPDDLVESWFNLMFPEVDPAFISGALERKKNLASSILSTIYDDKVGVVAATHFTSIVQNKKLPSNIPTTIPNTLLKIVAAQRKSTNGAARRLISQGGVSIYGGAKLFDCHEVIEPGMVLKLGKRDFVEIIERIEENDKRL